MTKPTVEINGRNYNWPRKPVVVICIDGGDPAYMDHGFSAGILPTVEKFKSDGLYTVVDGSMPSFTCPNNMSIITGTRPNVHGISGNFYLDRKTNQPVVMTGPELLRADTILSKFSKLGAKVVSITSKDKLRNQLQKDMDISGGSVSFSAQYADQCTVKSNGIENVLDYVGQPKPDMYSAELSLFVLDAGIKLLHDRRPDILYLSLTDFIQHGHAPGDPVADQFYIDLDNRIKRLVELGAVVGLIADHGMNDKADDQGEANVIWLQDILDQAIGENQCKVICPIADAFVGHHGSLGGFVRVYCDSGALHDPIIEVVNDIPGIEKVWTAHEVSKKLDQPLDREGDVAVLGDLRTVIGGKKVDHDLSALKGVRLRTHGSLHEAKVPFVVSEPISSEYYERAFASTLGSEDIFDYVINGIE